MISAATAQARVESRLAALAKRGGAVTEVQRRRLRAAAHHVESTGQYPDSDAFERLSLAPWLFFSGGERLRVSAADDLPLDYLLWSRGEVWDLADAAERRRYLDAALARRDAYEAHAWVAPPSRREATTLDNRRAFVWAAAVAAGWLFSLAGGAVLGVTVIVLAVLVFEIKLFGERRDPHRDSSGRR